MIIPSPTTTSQHDERLIHWLSVLHHALPAERVPPVFADKRTTLARRIALLEGYTVYQLDPNLRVDSNVDFSVRAHQSSHQ
jgi:hypothetical protein